jgi:hypothetical protein
MGLLPVIGVVRIANHFIYKMISNMDHTNNRE